MGIIFNICIKSLLLICSTCFLATSYEKELTFFITDFGINQYKDDVLKTGDNFVNAKSSVFPTLPKEGQVLIVMPSHQDLEKLTDNEVRQEILTRLSRLSLEFKRSGTVA